MCMTSETVEALHAVTSELKDTNELRDNWLACYDKSVADETELDDELNVTRAEAEMIFTARRTAIEAKLKELGWSKTTRVEPSSNGEPK